MAAKADLEQLSRALEPVAVKARGLPWASERAWTPRTHLGASNGLPMVDLHDLSVRLALDVIEVVTTCELEAGGAVLITGRGRHTGGRSKLRDSVLSALREHEDVHVKELGPGRVEIVWDAERVRAARPGMGVLFWLFVALLLLGVLASLAECVQNP